MWKFIISLFDKYRGIGTNKRGMVSRGMSGARLQNGMSRVWILSRNFAQPMILRGEWADAEDWGDENIWYD